MRRHFADEIAASQHQPRGVVRERLGERVSNEPAARDEVRVRDGVPGAKRDLSRRPSHDPQLVQDLVSRRAGCERAIRRKRAQSVVRERRVRVRHFAGGSRRRERVERVGGLRRRRRPPPPRASVYARGFPASPRDLAGAAVLRGDEVRPLALARVVVRSRRRLRPLTRRRSASQVAGVAGVMAVRDGVAVAPRRERGSHLLERVRRHFRIRARALHAEVVRRHPVRSRVHVRVDDA
eukprot:29684-Pelagococcus_subviridis.AAC.1